MSGQRGRQYSFWFDTELHESGFNTWVGSYQQVAKTECSRMAYSRDCRASDNKKDESTGILKATDGWSDIYLVTGNDTEL